MINRKNLLRNNALAVAACGVAALLLRRADLFPGFALGAGVGLANGLLLEGSTAALCYAADGQSPARTAVLHAVKFIGKLFLLAAVLYLAVAVVRVHVLGLLAGLCAGIALFIGEVMRAWVLLRNQ